MVKVDYDTNKLLPNAVYAVWPDGIRMLISSISDMAPTDYSSVGTIIDDGGGPLGGNQATSSATVFDGNAATFYDASNGDAGKYVGRDLVDSPVAESDCSPAPAG